MSSFFTDIPLCWSFCAMRTVYEYFFLVCRIYFSVVSFSNGRCFFGGMLLFLISLLQLSLLYFLSIRFIIRYKCCVQWYFHRLFSMVFCPLLFFFSSLSSKFVYWHTYTQRHTVKRRVHTVFTSNKCSFCNCVSVVCYSLPFSFSFFVLSFFIFFRISVLFSRHQGNNKNKKKLCTNCVCTVYCTINARAYLITITICSCLLIFIYVTKIILLRITKRANEVKPGQEDRRTDRERECVSSFNCFTTFSYSNLIVTCEELQTFSSFLFCRTMEIIIKKTLKTKLVVKWLINEEI